MAAKDSEFVSRPKFDDPQLEKRYKRLENIAIVGVLVFFIGVAASLSLFFIMDLRWYSVGVIIGTSVISEILLRQGTKADTLARAYGKSEPNNAKGTKSEA
ncbi:MAG: hypothetical protein JRN21_09745 [Nitrososphaerota archaeon]|nr:hypothetical protein [Nitrososphaerota archaeon]